MAGSLQLFPLLASSILVAGLLAGCGGAKAGSQRDPDPYVQPKGFSEITGSVRGYVVDEEFYPLKDAIVGFIDPYQATKTNEAGEFEIGQLHPGKRNLYVIHLGHKSAGKRIEIKANEPTEVTFVLPVLPIEEPWIDIVRKTLSFGQSVRVTPGSVGYANGTNSHGWIIKDKVAALDALYFQAQWTQSQSLSGGIRFVFGLGGSATAAQFFTLEGRSPLVGKSDRAGIEQTIQQRSTVCVKEPCRLQWTATTAPGVTGLSVDVGVMVEQPYSVYVAHFYRQPMPEFYTIVS